VVIIIGIYLPSLNVTGQTNRFQQSSMKEMNFSKRAMFGIPCNTPLTTAAGDVATDDGITSNDPAEDI
jgi:hypothetical protein